MREFALLAAKTGETAPLVSGVIARVHGRGALWLWLMGSPVWPI